MHPSFVNAELLLSEARGVYYAGQLLTGSLNCELREHLNLRAINVQFCGWTHVEWLESEVEEYNDVSRIVVVTYQGHEEYFNDTQTIFGGNYGELTSGKHVLPFQFQIPHKVPSSFNGRRGKVIYTVTVYVEYSDPMLQRDEIGKEFEIVAPMDLNVPEIMEKIELQFEETLSCCFSSSLLSLTLSAPVSGYCPGQSIPITVVCDQDSVEVKRIIMQLIKRETYRSRQPPSEFSSEEVLITEKLGPVIADPRRKITCSLTVPDMIAPNMDNCEFIDIGYSLRVKIQLPACQDDLEDEADLCIGLVPIPGTEGSDTYTHPLASDLPTSPVPSAPSEIVAQHTGYANTDFSNPQPGFPNPQLGFPNPQPGFPNPQPGFPNPQPGFPNPQPGFPSGQSGYPNQQIGFPNPQPGYPNPQPGFPNPQPGYPNQQQGYPNQQPGFPNPQSGYPNQQPSFPIPQQSYPNQVGHLTENSMPQPRSIQLNNIGFVQPSAPPPC